MGEQFQIWRLREFVVGQAEDGSWHWMYWVDPGDGLSRIYGRARLEEEQNVLVMSPWKVRDSSCYKNLDEVEKYLETLPQWDKTTYYVEVTSFGSVYLRVCKTGEAAPDEVVERIMRKLGFTPVVKDVPRRGAQFLCNEGRG